MGRRPQPLALAFTLAFTLAATFAVSVAVVVSLPACSSSDGGGPTKADAQNHDGPGLSFKDGPRGDGWRPPDAGPRDTLRVDADGLPPPPDAAGDAPRADGPTPDLLAPDVLPPDVLPPDILPADVLPPDTLAHKCTTHSAFSCTPNTFIIQCISTCTDHLARVLRLVCTNSQCNCQINGTNKKTCPRSGSGCAACANAFSCCAF